MRQDVALSFVYISGGASSEYRILAFELLYGHRVRGPLDILKESREEDKISSDSVVEYVLQMRERIAAMRITAHENQVESQRKQKSYYNRRSRDRSFKEGDKVPQGQQRGKNRMRSVEERVQ